MDLFSLLVFVIVMGLIYWLITILPLPEPFKKIAIVIFVVICVIYVLSLLFGVVGTFPIARHWRN